MSEALKNQNEILEKFNIEKLNSMQQDATTAIQSSDEVVLLSPTGSGKTLAFLLPLVAEIEMENIAVQAIILTPSRELAIQIEQVLRDMGTGLKVSAFYGGQNFSKDKIALQHPPHIIVGTPGRLADHFWRHTIPTLHIKTIVLDEFDKSLEVGFEEDMKDILEFLSELKKKILTSATYAVTIPEFMGLKNPTVVNHLIEKLPSLQQIAITSPNKDKLKTLLELLEKLGRAPGIVFCSFKDSIERISEYLTEHEVAHDCFHGGLEQKDRERVLIKFRNGTNNLIIATDLAARGLDIDEIQFIIHYHLPTREKEYIHRNGRTARMHKEGRAYIIHWVKEDLPEFISRTIDHTYTTHTLPVPEAILKSKCKTLFISGGRKDKISKGDIAGWLIANAKIDHSQIGLIELKQDCAFVAIPSTLDDKVILDLANHRLKKRKVRVEVI